MAPQNREGRMLLVAFLKSQPMGQDIVFYITLAAVRVMARVPRAPCSRQMMERYMAQRFPEAPQIRQYQTALPAEHFSGSKRMARATLFFGILGMPAREW